MTDPLLVAQRLPQLAERAMREAIVGVGLARTAGGRPPSQRLLTDSALIRFEHLVERAARDGIRPALLFAERDRIGRELHAFIGGRLAARLFALRRRDLVAIGRAAGSVDAFVRGRRGGVYGVAFRRLAGDGRRLEAMRALRWAARDYPDDDLRGVLVYDFTSGTLRTLRCAPQPAKRPAA